jgi:hypothetical protein
MKKIEPQDKKIPLLSPFAKGGRRGIFSFHWSLVTGHCRAAAK